MKKYVKSDVNSDYAAWKKDYDYVLKRYPELSRFYGVNGVIGKCTTTRYEKIDKRWVETESETVDMTAEFYLNGISSAPFFRNLGGVERLTPSYTRHGYIPVELVSVSPDRNTKVVRSYDFT